MITKDTQVIGVSPRINAIKFGEVLLAAGSPAFGEAYEMFNAIAVEGVDPAFLLACFKKESQYATDPASIVVRYHNFNMGNCRSSRIGITETVTDPKRGTYVKYPDWATGAKDAAYRLIDKSYDYAKAGATTIEQIIKIWAPKEDGNDPAGYANTVVTLMNGWIGDSAAMQDPVNKLDIVHPNKGRGGASPEIIVLHVQEGTNDLPSFFRSSGDDSTIWCKQDGTLVRMEQDTDSAWTNGYMTEPIDHANPHIQSLVNRGVTNSNNYSLTVEHQGYAANQFTDAAIEATAKMCAYWMSKYGWTDVDTRIVGHYQIGEHKNCPGPNFPWAKLKARVKDLIGGATTLTTDNHTPLPKPADNRVNGFVVGGGFGEFYKKLAGVSPNFELLVLGLPLTEEFDADLNGDGNLNTVQLFERSALVYESAAASPWDVHAATIRQLAAIVDAARNKGLVKLPTA